MSNLTTISVAFGESNGITGMSGKQGLNCVTAGCHSGTDLNSTLTFNSATSVAPGSTVDINLLLQFSNPSDHGYFAGINAAISDNGGVLIAGTTTSLINGELTHRSPIETANNQVSWNFQWTAPSSPGMVTLYACSETVDRNLTNLNDDNDPACIEQNIAITAVPNPTTNNQNVSVSNDFNGDGNGDILFRDNSSLSWTMAQVSGFNILESAVVDGMSVVESWQFNGAGDFDGDGVTDIIIRNSVSGSWFIYNLSGSSIVNRGYVPLESAKFVGVQAVSDFNNDGFADVLVRNENTGEWTINLLRNRTVLESLSPPMSRVTTWQIVTAKDIDGNGSADIMIRNSNSGTWYAYLYSGTDIINRGYIADLPASLNDVIQGVGDFNGDGSNDVLTRNTETNVWSISYMNGLNVHTTETMGFSVSPGWQFAAAEDVNGDGYTDVVIQNKTSRQLYTYNMGANGVISTRGNIGSPFATSLEVQELNIWRADDANDDGSGGDGGDTGGGDGGDTGGGDGGDTGNDDSATTDFYVANISTPIIQTRCIVCHVSGGIADGQSRILFQRSSATNYQATNQQAFQTFLALSDVTSSYILSKASGGNGHVGGTQLPVGSTEYNNLETYLNMETGATGGNDNPDQDNFWSGVSLLDADLTLRKTALLFGQMPPSDAQYASLSSNSSSALKQHIQAQMQGEGFHDFLVRSANDKLLTDRFIERETEALDPNGRYYPSFTNRSYELRASGDNETFYNYYSGVRWGFSRAAPELVAYVIENNRPYTEILTADYTMLNPFTNHAFRGDATGFADTNDYTEFRPGKIHGVMLQTNAFEEIIDDIGLRITEEGPNVTLAHAGILTDNAWLARYPTTATNRNRARSRWTYYHFLDFDIEKSAQRSQNPADLADTNNPTMNNANCTVCHQLLDPIAGSYQNFGEFGWYRDREGGTDSLAYSYKYEQGTPYLEGDTWYRDMRNPGFEDQTAPSNSNSLQWLAQQITQDSRFAASAVKFWWPALTGAQPLNAPEDITDARYSELNAAFTAQSVFINQLATDLSSHWDMKRIFADILVSEWYRANANSNQMAQGQNEIVAGTERLLTPEQLNEKTKLLTGHIWNEEYQPDEYEDPSSSLTDEYRLSYGGIDSDGITERATEMTSIMSQIALAHSAETSCPIVVTDFVREEGQRYLFNGIQKTTSPNLINESSHNVDGIWAENNTSFSMSETLPAGDNVISVVHTNDLNIEELAFYRDLAVNKLQIYDANNNLVTEIQATENNTSEENRCGGQLWNSEEDSDESSDWHIWGNCALSFPVNISTAGEYRIVVDAYQLAWTDQGQVFTHDHGPAQMVIRAQVTDPLTQASASGTQIKEKLAELHFLLWGEKVTADSAEVQQTFALFVASWHTHKTDNIWNHINDSAACRIHWEKFNTPENDNRGWMAGLDPKGTLATWKTVMAYMLSDYKYLHE